MWKLLQNRHLHIALSKCAVMTLDKVTSSKYVIINIQLENVNFYKDLGIIFEYSLIFYLINILIIFVKKTYISFDSIFRCIIT